MKTVIVSLALVASALAFAPTAEADSCSFIYEKLEPVVCAPFEAFYCVFAQLPKPDPQHFVLCDAYLLS